MAAEEAEVPDFYELLGARDNAGEKELQKCFRRQALQCHPDKNPTPEAAAKFHLLTIAIDTLTDAERRRKYDASRSQKLEAQRRRDRVEGERRAWIDELERGEQAAGKGESDRKRRRQDTESREEELSRMGAKLRADLAQRMMASKTGSPATSTTTPKESPRPSEAPATASLFTSRDKTLKVKFRGRATEAQLRTIFQTFGDVGEVLYRETDKRTQSALVEFAQIHSAFKASTAELSSFAGLEVREVTWAYGRIPDLAQLSNLESSDRSETSVPHTPQTAMRTGMEQEKKIDERSDAVFKTKLPKLSAGTDYESAILLRMRQRQREKEENSAK